MSPSISGIMMSIRTRHRPTCFATASASRPLRAMTTAAARLQQAAQEDAAYVVFTTQIFAASKAPAAAGAQQHALTLQRWRIGFNPMQKERDHLSPGERALDDDFELENCVQQPEAPHRRLAPARHRR